MGDSIPDEVLLRKSMLAAEGYSQLGMPVEALDELNRIGEIPEIAVPLENLRLQIQMRARRWQDAERTAERLCRLDPEDPDHFIHRAFCLHETGHTKEARESLQGGPGALTAMALYHYNLACYDAVLGDIEEAQAHLRQAFQLDAKYREFARTDEDLKAVRALL